VDTLKLILPVITAMVRTLKINPDKLRAALDPAMLATDLADYLVDKGLPFREAHHVSGRAVRLAVEKGITLSDLSHEDLSGLSLLFAPDVLAVFNFEASVARRKSPNGTAPTAVRQQIQNARQWLQTQGT